MLQKIVAICGDLVTNYGELRQIAANCGELAKICGVGLILEFIFGGLKLSCPLF
jgi:hypothetical protein